ncbi:MAG: DUF2892 domain-containing protein [Gemmatimonadaceae bacterium]|nr:DUF2892 domain-containing protein [Gemmatimonadaceae bacterium]
MTLAISGPRRVPRTTAGRPANVGRPERWASVLAGSALAVYGLDRRDAGGTILALLGAALVHRGATARCPLYTALSVSTADDADGDGSTPTSPAAAFRASDAVKVERSITVNRAPAELYALWKDPLNLPRFMTWLEEVHPIDGRRARWKAKGPAGTSIEWVAEVINEVPDSLIAWKSVANPDIKNAGSVHFRRQRGTNATEVRLVFEWVPPGGRAGMAVAKLLGSNPANRIADGLKKFKRLAERD